jgi:hypothetical protein
MKCSINYVFGATVLVLLTYSAQASTKYPVRDIPDDLKKDVNVVVREDHIIHTIYAKSKASLSVRMVATIFNKMGSRYASPSVSYNKLSKVSVFKGNVYDAQGNLIRKLKPSDIADRSAYDGFSLFSDARYKSADLSHGSYPYTVEYEYVVEYRYLYGIQGSALVSDEKVAVQKFLYKLMFPPDLAPRYKTLHIDTDPVREKQPGGMESLTWTFENIKPIKVEPHGPFISEQVPRILAAPSKFEYEGYAGDMSTWESYGVWEARLNEGRDVLLPATQEKILELTKNLSTTEEKAKALYEYLQNKTRYVSIALGIGGLQPFEASVVDQTGYGDCKALSNYMVAMLKVAGITGYYATIKAGEFRDDLMLDFPSHQGNHVIVAVPNGADTLWLECTSQTNPFGYAGTFTGDRKAFLLTENGAVWANTPRYTHAHNVQSRTADVFIDLTGDAKARIRTTYSGLQYENDKLNFVLNNHPDEQRKWIQKHAQIPSFDLNDFSIENRKEKIPVAEVRLDLTLRRYSTVSGKRIFITPNLMNRSTYTPPIVENRKTNVLRRMTYTDIDTIRYHVPEGVYPEFLPEPVEIKSPFGEYSASIIMDKADKGIVLYVRKVVMYKGEFPAESYSDLIDLHKAINKADNIKLVFLTKT